MKEKIRDNGEKIKQNKVLPYLVGNVVEVRVENPQSQSLTNESYRSLSLTHKKKRMAQTRMLIRCAKERAPSSKPRPDRLYTFP